MEIKPSDFADECVNQGLRFGVHAHYLMAVAQLRSGLTEQNDGDRISAFRLTQTEWDANCFDEELGIKDFLPTDINDWDMQCCIYALMTLRAQNDILNDGGDFPSAVDLYRKQWPDAPADIADKLQQALDATAQFVEAAYKDALGEVVEDAGDGGAAGAGAGGTAGAGDGGAAAGTGGGVAAGAGGGAAAGAGGGAAAGAGGGAAAGTGGGAAAGAGGGTAPGAGGGAAAGTGGGAAAGTGEIATDGGAGGSGLVVGP